MKKIKIFLELIRVKHWIKNVLLFIPMVTAKLINFNNLYITSLGFISFSCLTSFVYIINDIKDIEKDKLHPRKKKRPLPSGKISKNIAIYIAILMVITSITINIFITKSLFNLSFIFLIIYLLMNLGYSFGLKDIAVLDIIILASGFVLRVYYGAEIIDVNVSNWLFLTILNASLFLGLGKRKKEFETNKNARKVLKEYNDEFLDKFQYITLSLTLVFYSLWTMDQNIKYLFLTIPLLMAIFMKYCLIIEKSDEGDPTTILYQDKNLIILCIVYSLLMILFILK